MTYEEFRRRFSYDVKTDRLGSGGFGNVYEAYDNDRDRKVAIKMAEVKSGHENVRLRKEVYLVKDLKTHRNVAYYEECHTFDLDTGEFDFGIMQLYDDGDLDKLIKSGALTAVQKTSILTQLLDGIEFLHDNDIFHRDLKPRNILIVKRGNEYIPKITDFGISKKVDRDQSSVFGNSLVGGGTLAYASPEQLRSTTIRRNTDLWSFGVIAFQMLTGRLPFNTGPHSSTSEAGRSELLRQIVAGELPGTIGDISEPWRGLIRRCLVVDPEKRVRNVGQCRDILSGKGWVQPSPKPPQTPPPPIPLPPKPSPPPKPPETPSDDGTTVDDGTKGGGTIREPKPGPVSPSPPTTKPEGKMAGLMRIVIVVFVAAIVPAMILTIIDLANDKSNRPVRTPAHTIDSTIIQQPTSTPTNAQPMTDNGATERAARENAAKLKNAKTAALSAFNSRRWDEALKQWQIVKSLDPNDNTGYNSFLTQAKNSAAAAGSWQDEWVQRHLKSAKALRNTTEVNELLQRK